MLMVFVVGDGIKRHHMLDGARSVDKPPVHRMGLWTAAVRCVTCPPLPELEPSA